MVSRQRVGRPTKTSVKRLARKCGCGKLGYTSELTAMDAVISGRYSRAGVRVYRCDRSELWHTTSKRQLPEHAKAMDMHVTELTPSEEALVHAARAVRKLRADGVKGETFVEANNAAQAALSKAGRSE